MAGNTNFATLATTTLSNFANDIFDNVVTNNAALSELKKSGNIKVVGGGRTFTHPIFYKQNTSYAAYSRYGTIPTELEDPLTRSEYSIKVIAGSVVYSLVEEAMNAGDKEKLIDLVESYKMAAESSMAEVLGDQVMKAKASVGSDDFDSIPYIISDTVSTDTNQVGGINSSAAAQTWWRNQTHAATIGTFSSTQIGLNAMDTMLNKCTYGKQGPTFIITTKSIFTLYNLVLQPQVRYSKLDAGESGFRNLLYATLPIYFDDNCPATHMYFIDGNALKLQVLAQGNMKMSPFVQAYNQLMARALLYVLGNITCGSRRTSGVITTINA